MKVLVINPGATSTKIAVFDEENEILRISVDHSAQARDLVFGQRVDAELRGDLIQYGHGAVHDLGADAVALQKRDIEFHMRYSLSFRYCSSPPWAMIFSMNGGKAAAWKVRPAVSSVMTPV